MENIPITYKIPRMETIRDTAKLFNLPEHFVRCAVKGEYGHLFSVKAGNKNLINCEKFAAFLNCELESQEQDSAVPAQNVGVMRPVPVRL